MRREVWSATSSPFPIPSGAAPRLPGSSEFARYLRTETVGGIVLLAATAVALIRANSPWREVYTGLRDTVVGPAALHLDLTLAQWATDGLLAVFFYVVGLELERELVVGELSTPRQALLPVAAALGGMVVPTVLAAVVGQGACTARSPGWCWGCSPGWDRTGASWLAIRRGPLQETVKAAVLLSSAAASLIGAALLARRGRVHAARAARDGDD